MPSISIKQPQSCCFKRHTSRSDLANVRGSKYINLYILQLRFNSIPIDIELDDLQADFWYTCATFVLPLQVEV